MSLSESFSVLRPHIDEATAAALARLLARAGATTRSSNFAEAVLASAAGGKRFRALMAHVGWALASGKPLADASVPHLAAALELYQASALVHDDIIDHADERRGQPTPHRALATRHSDAGWIGSSSAFGQDVEILALGQYLDILAEQHPLDPQRADALSADAALEVALHKSAHYSVVHPGVLGAICGAPSLAQALPLIEVLETILTPWGLAFQLRDDDLGVFGDPAVTGKPAGDDLREGKRTVLLALTWAASSPAERTALTEVLGVAEASAEQIARATAIIERNGRAAHEAEIARLVEEGHRALDASHVDADAASMLRELCDILTARRA